MSIDVSALKKFAETFGPAVDAIPGVLEAVSRQADLDRMVAEKTKKLDKIEADMAEAEERAAESKAAANAEVTRIREIVAELSTDVGELQARKSMLEQEYEAEGLEREEIMLARLDDIEKRVGEAEKAFAAKKATLDAAHAADVEEREAEIEALEAKRKMAQEALDRLKNSL